MDQASTCAVAASGARPGFSVSLWFTFLGSGCERPNRMDKDTKALQGGGCQVTPSQELALQPLCFPTVHSRPFPHSFNPTVSLQTGPHPCPLEADVPMRLLPAGHRFFQFMLC